jgi:hypothetical protein
METKETRDQEVHKAKEFVEEILLDITEKGIKSGLPAKGVTAILLHSICASFLIMVGLDKFITVIATIMMDLGVPIIAGAVPVEEKSSSIH